MRDYRGIPIDGKDFVYGWYFQRAGASFIIPISDEYHTPASFVLTFVQVIPKTVGQSTGLKDKNKKECYFEDIVKHNNGDAGVIRWDEGKLRVRFDWNDGTVSYPIEHFDYIDFEIIGDIHTEPELLEKQ